MPIRKILLAALLGCLASNAVLAATQPPALLRLVEQVLEEHPAVRAAAADLAAAEAAADAASRPLYNPELELDTEQTAANATYLGLSQTIDWGGKRKARKDIGNHEKEAARAALALARLDVARRLLEGLNAYHTAAATSRLARRRVALLEDFLRLARQRFSAGDVGRSDVDLARLSLSESRMAAAEQASRLAAADAELRTLVLSPPPQWPALASLPPPLAEAPVDEALLAAHPRLRQARARAGAGRAGMALARKSRRPDPTVGVRGGRDDEDTLLGLTLTLPLFVRNDFRAEVRAAAATARSGEERLRDVRRNLRAAMEAAASRYRLIRAALEDWEREGSASLRGRVDLLRRLWESGEINTIDYLVQLQQTLDTEQAAQSLRGAAWDAWLAWLTASAQVEQWLGIGTKHGASVHGAVVRGE
ncbi:MAG TPA: TolC family protein [Gammaproteobacteria bacterium]|nr:TolC family protein [Gammaproteobacteria bacterium]